MKALLLSKYRHLELIDAPVPLAGPGEVLVRVAACGICGSDVHGYDGSSRRIPLKRPGQHQDLDAAVVFLAAESSRYVNGQALLVDGGISTGATRTLVQSLQTSQDKPGESS